MTPPLVSVNIVTRNRANLLKKAIFSVLKQSYQNLEIIIIDDDSTDSTKSVVNSIKDNRIKYFKIEKQDSLNIARNLAIKYSSGKYIAVLDDDDEWIDNNKLKKQINFLENNKDYALIGTGVICVDKNGNELYRFLNHKTNKEIKKYLLGRDCFVHSSVMFNKEVALNNNLYNETNKNNNLAEDYGLWLRIGTKYKLYNLPEYSTKLLINNQSHGRKNLIKQFNVTIKLVNKYKKYYPKNRILNILRNYFRLFFYGYLKLNILTKLSVKIKKLLNKL